MQTLNNLNIQNIANYNPWYKNSNFLFAEEKFAKRQQFFLAKKYLNKELMIALIGLRRAGKTTIIRQLINFLLIGKFRPEQIFFYSFDDENIDLESNLNFYFKNILKKDLYKAECYIFLDELQFVNNWQATLKKYYDLNPRCKFIISGSTHLYLHKNTKESLAGRIIDINILPFGWHEFLNFKYQKNYNFVPAILEDNFLKIAQANSQILLYQDDFKTFLSYGEYPYFFHETNPFELDRYFRDSILDKIFNKDINLFDIANRRNFSELYKVLNNESGQEINLRNLARETGLNVITIKRYIEILEKMFLYGYIYKYSKSLRKQIMSFKKGYASSLNLCRASVNLDYWNIDNDRFGHIIETFVYNELVKNGFKNITFFHDTKINKEVDFVIADGKKIVPIEVKISRQVSMSQLKNLVYFMKKNKLNRGILLSGDSEITPREVDGCRIECLPYFMI